MLQNRQTAKIDSRESQKLNVDSKQHAAEYLNAKNVITCAVY